MELSGSNALVTGASGGIGRHLVAGLARRGANLALSGRDAERLEEAADLARREG
ncbi:MAG: SDR family NAD(P)-dependent oxidoreductase, partial [Actinomycetota bacterium]|nr:SDR family NAD(P)-dependent oxidoreductase [Actinomycetota bacterium]